ncbi:MAG: tetratricopeptide repeat protein, partial [Planctomycetaceae bacterium]|nr:tetratricopeptide repeat protein [Planctomycetaceae bacterium]
MTDANSNVQTQDRTIRVFVSSTFRDMQAERDELVLRIFPQLRRLCEERGVTWGEVDLRWGITEQQAERGEVLPICLEEIKRCRPYFIGLLGERYGWIPDAIAPELIEREPWLGERVHGKKSATELEILHGVLNNPQMTDHAFFYFRDPAFLEKVVQNQQTDFTTEDTASAEKLKRLKDDIRTNHRNGTLRYAPREDYADAKALGELVLADFTALIDTLYPPGTQPTPLERERMDHEAFARSRASVYIGRQEYFDRLDAHVAGADSPLIVLGESGGGKSALLSNWALRYREQHPDDFLLLHFIGGSPDSANATGILRRIMLELKQRFALPDDVPAQPEKIREAFPNWLAQTAGSGRVVLVLDALNQLEDIDRAPDLGWLPCVFPKNCRVILSTLPSRSLNAVESRGWLQHTPPLQVQPLDETERRRLIQDFLKQYTRDLGTARTEQLAHAHQSSNPLYLRVLLNELRVFGIHEKLGERIDWYLEAENPYELYRKVIARWEEAYADGTKLVSDTLLLLWAARRGLSEFELLEALGEHGRPLPRAVWSPLFLAMSDALVSRSGLLTFAHDFLRTATRDVCLSSEPDQQRAHRRLAEYFQRQTAWSDRRLDELPWQLAAAGERQQLHVALSNPACFLGLNKRNEYELLGYWLRLKPEFDLATSYTAAFAHWEQHVNDDSRLGYVANALATFFRTAACHTAAEPLCRRALAMGEKSLGKDHPNVAVALNNLAQLLQSTNRPAEAEPLFRRALAIDEQSFGLEHPQVATALNNLAALLRDTNRLREAEPLMCRAVQIFEKSHGRNHPSVAVALSNLASLLQSTNRLAEAEPLMRRALAIDEQSYGKNHPRVATVLNNLSLLMQATNRLAEAEPLMRRTLAIDEQFYGPNHPDVARDIANLSTTLFKMNRLAEAEPLMRRTIAIWEQSLGFHHP